MPLRPLMPRLVAICCTVAACVGAAVAQEEGGPFAAPAPAVYVRDSGVAAERLALAQRMERQKEWDKSADVYHDVAVKFADRLIPSQTDDKGQPTQYVSAARVVQRRLAAWPPEGLAAYRRRFEDTARDLLASTPDDTAVVTRVASEYFLTDAGRDAAMRQMADAFERGDFATAAGIGRRLLDSHPGLAADRPVLLLRTGLAEHLADRDDDARKRLGELKSRFAEALGRVAGVDARLAETLERQLAVPAVTASGSFRSDDWPSPFGTPHADAVPDAVTAGGAKLFSIELATVRQRNVPAEQFRAAQASMASQRRLGALSGILPAVEGGALFFQDNARVYAIDLASGLPLPGWAATYAGARRGAFAVDTTSTPPGRQMAVSVSGDSVIALLGQFNTAMIGASFNGQPPQIVCLDRATGRRVWATSMARLKLPDDQTALRDGMFYGTPLVDGDTVYTLVAATRGGQFDECYVVALKLSDGSYRWSSYVASVSTGNGEIYGQPTPSPAAAVSLAAGRLFVLTNLGALACLDAASGRTEWLNLYPRNRPTADTGARFIRNRVVVDKPFALGPPIVSGGRVFAMPNDSATVNVYDAADGTPLHQVPRRPDARFTQPATMLLGVVGDQLVLANAATLFRVPWKNFDPAKSLVDNGGLYKNITPEEGNAQDPPDSIRGRPFVSSKAVLVTTNERLYRVSLGSFRIESVYPAQGKWDEEESAGNVLATTENLIIAGPTRITAYADLAGATAKLDARIAADARDVDAHLRYADLLFAAGKAEAALAKLDSAAAQLGGLASLTPGPLRDRLFESAASFAVKLRRSNADAKVADAIFDRAAAAAHTPQQQVRYRVSRAAVFHDEGNVVAELALCQEILSQAEWRAVPAVGRGVPSTAGVQAEAAVADLVRIHGPTLYASYDRAAAERLAAIQASPTPDADALLGIADEFPAAAQAPDVIAAAADRFQATGQPRRAAQALRRVLKRDLSNERRQVVLQSLALNYLLVPNQAANAQVWLRQARSLAPSAKLAAPLTLADGTVLSATTLAEAIAALDVYRKQTQRQSLPKLGAALTSGGGDPTKPPLKAAIDIGAAAAIVEQQADLLRNDCVVVFGTDRRVGVAKSSSDAVSWTEAMPAGPPVGCGFIGETLVVVSPSEATAVDAGGKKLWSTPLSSLPPVDAAGGVPSVEPPTEDDAAAPPTVVDPRLRLPRGVFRRNNIQVPESPDSDALAEGVERVLRCRVLSDRVVVGTSVGRVAALDLKTGALAWQARVSELPVGRLLSNDDFVAVSFADPPASSSVFVFDAMTGQTVLTKTYDGNTAPQAGGLVNLALSPDGVLVTMLSSRLIGIDLYDSGSGDWKHDATPRPNRGEQPFIASGEDDQLVLTADRVLAVYRTNSGAQSVHAYALRTLKPLVAADERVGQAAEIAYAPRGGDPEGTPLAIAASGSAFYIIGPRSLAAYNLDRVGGEWAASAGAGRGPNRGAVLTQDFVVQISQLTAANPTAPVLPAVQLSMYSRAVTSAGDESGVLEQRPTVRDPSGIRANQWQVVDGAFYYVSGNQKLKAMRVNP